VDFDAAVAELLTLVETLERDGDERALLLLQLVDAIHRPGIERLAAGDRDHPLAQAVLAMYELDDADPAVLAGQAPEFSLVDLLRGPVFADAGAPLEDGLRAVEVDGVAVLLAAVDGEVHAFRNACAVDGRPLDGGRLAGSVLVCPWHNCAYDARSGRRVDDEAAPGLAVVPVRTGDGAVRVAVNVA
jgi:nitrite reductase/ring-hydroxylating ferredoxin subunit